MRRLRTALCDGTDVMLLPLTELRRRRGHDLSGLGTHPLEALERVEVTLARAWSLRLRSNGAETLAASEVEMVARRRPLAR